ncbi:MAG: hypothetical protein IPK08_20440 [Bacteroidetes bacterium]|nr:hypothetical protein [Bacteroidota bacterium]
MQTADGGYILGGWSTSGISGDKTENGGGYTDYWIVKTDSLGIIQWQNTIGGSGDDELYSLSQTFDGGIFWAVILGPAFLGIKPNLLRVMMTTGL